METIEQSLSSKSIMVRQLLRQKLSVMKTKTLCVSREMITKIVHCGILIYVLCLFSLLRLFDELFDVIIDVNSRKTRLICTAD